MSQSDYRETKAASSRRWSHRVILWTDPETGDERHIVVKPVIHLDVVADCRTRDAAEKIAADLNAREVA